MSDIISEISRISEDELRMQIALIDNVNISNAVKETGYRLVNVLADVANSFTQSIGIKNSIDYEVKKVSDLVREDCLRYKALNRCPDTLLMRRHLHTELINICHPLIK